MRSKVTGDIESGSITYGFITNEVKELFPELIFTDENGNTYVDYLAMIPVLVAALGEQQRNIQLLQGQVAVMNRSLAGMQDTATVKSMARSTATVNSIVNDMPQLYQNNPNPFSSQTTISYYIPTGASQAAIYLFSLNGTLLQTLPIATFGNGSVTINGETLSAGMYVYSLVVDNTIIDSKRMILTSN